MVINETFDLTNCDREPIHIPGLIQPHGALLVLQASTFKIIQVSSNTLEILYVPPEQLLDKSLLDLLDSQQIQQIQQCLTRDFESINPLNITINHSDKYNHFNGIVHRCNGLIILELEPKKSQQTTDFLDFYQQVKGIITQIQKAPSLLAMCQSVVKQIREITGFERVMVYRFDPDGVGSIIAEDTDQEPSYLNLRYPASDIPKQARQLYTLNWLRLVPDINYQPVVLIPDHNPLTNQPLDLSLSVLRSVSPYISNTYKIWV